MDGPTVLEKSFFSLVINNSFPSSLDVSSSGFIICHISQCSRNSFHYGQDANEKSETVILTSGKV